jgi:hypothetical protein
MTREEMKRELEWFAAYYDAKLNKAKAEVWFELFKDRSVERFHTALMKHVQNDQYPTFPAAGKITELLSEAPVHYLSKADVAGRNE